MKKHLLNALTVLIMLAMPVLAFAQPTLGTAKNFVLFSGAGAVSNSGAGTLTLLTGNIGTNGATVTSGFGNIDGVKHDNDAGAGSAPAAADLLAASNEIDALASGTVIAHVVGFGAGESLPAGVYKVDAAANFSGELTLTGTATDKFIFIINGTLSIATNSKIILAGGATACNVFWQTNGVIDVSTGADLKGTFIAKSGAITMSGVTLEGRALAVVGAITVSELKAKIPIGCAGTNPSPALTGPTAPALGTTECYVLLTGNENVTGTVPTALYTGDIGTNVGLTSGFTLLNVAGTVHASPDPSTAQATTDLLPVYNYLNGLAADITLLYPAVFGNNLVLTPHTYKMDAAAILTGKLYLNAQGDANARFVIKVTGAFETAVGAEVILINNAQAKNVFWLIKDGAVTIKGSTAFKGTIVANAGAIALMADVALEGRGLTLTGAITSAAASAHMPPGCSITALPSYDDINVADEVVLYPNPSRSSSTFMIKNASQSNNYELRVFNSRGMEVLCRTITNESTTLEAGALPPGLYFYKMTGKNKTVKSGTMILQR